MQSEKVDALTKAMVKVQAELKPAIKDSDNPFFKSKYADLPAVVHVSRKLLTDNGIAVYQVTDMDEQGRTHIVTQLTHESGQWIRGKYPVNPVKQDPQAMGSAITYARRYAYCAMVGIVTDEDDDGNAASGNDDKPAKSVFKTAAARKEFVQNVLNSISECQTSDEVDTIMRLNAAKIKEMKASGNEYDALGVDSIKNNVELRRAQIADSAMDEQFKETTQ